MYTEVIMAKYGEIALKGQNKRAFEDILVRNVKNALSRFGEHAFTLSQSTLYIEPIGETDINAAVGRLQNVFGLGAVQKCAVFPKDFAVIAKDGVPYLADALNRAKTFKIEAKRADKTFPMKTPDIQRELGGAVLDAYPHLTVDVHNPDVTVWLEIRENAAYLNPERLQGAGGIPVGSSGSALLLLSGGIDSPVAAYMLAKRGVHIDAVHFSSPPYTSERAFMKVESLCEALRDYIVKTRLYAVNFTEVQEAIKDNCPDEYATVILRRLMIKAANLIIKGKRYGALATGESLGQVASQTMQAIQCTDAAAETPILRPLIGFDKTEIVNIARKINTFDISALPYADCCEVFAPKHPRTKPRLEEVLKIESRFDYTELLENSVKNMKIKDF